MEQHRGLLLIGLLCGLFLAADTERLEQKLRSTNTDERRDAAKALAGMGDEASGAAKALTKALSDKDRFVRRFAAQALGAIGPSVAGSAIEPLARILNQFGETKEVQEAAAVSLGKMGLKGRDPLIAALQSRRLDPSVRQKAADSLGNLGADGASAVPALVQALDDPGTRGAAVGALGQIGPAARGAEKELRGMLENKQFRRDKALKDAVQSALKKISTKQTSQTSKKDS